MTRRTWTMFGAANFFFGGCGIAAQNGFLRFTGHKENAAERRRFGFGSSSSNDEAPRETINHNTPPPPPAAASTENKH